MTPSRSDLPRPRRRRRAANRRAPAVTIHDVAARAGVSVATVSRVLNRKEIVREETTNQVLAAAKQLPRDLPMVLLNSSDERHPAITIDNYGGARAMMRHLAGLGHKRIAFITGPASNADSRDRLRGYRQSMRGATRVEIAGDFTEHAGHEAVKQILAADPRPTAIFAANDSMAVGALSALHEAGIDVPRQMSVVGFDDIPIARYVNPPLTTIRVEIAELGRRAFAVLVETLAHPKSRVRRETIETTLIVRKSSGRQGETS